MWTREVEILLVPYFVIDKSYKEKLQEKINIFNEQTKHKYNIRLIMITSNGIEKNEHYGDVVNESLELSDIMVGGWDRIFCSPIK